MNRACIVKTAGLPALCLVYLDLLEAHSLPLWAGSAGVHWLFAAGAWAGEWAVVAGLAWAGYRLSGVFSRDTAIRLFAGTWGAAMALWIVLSASEPPFLSRSFVLGAVLISAVTVSTALESKKVRLFRRAALLWGIALAAGVLTLPLVTQLTLLHPQCARALAVSSLAVLGGVGVLFWLMCGVTRWVRKGGSSRQIAALLLLVALVVALLATRSWHRLRSGRDPRPSLILVTSDALRWDVCSAYGGPVDTPAVDALAARGVLFERSYALAPWTSPSLNSLFASVYPKSLNPELGFKEQGEQMGRYWVEPDSTVLAEMLSAEGYATGAFVGNPLLRHHDSILRGFQHTAWFHHLTSEQRGALRLCPRAQRLLGRVFPSMAPHRPIDTSSVLTEYSLAFLRAAKGRPFFLWVHFMDPHDPFDPPERFREGEPPWPVFSPVDDAWGGPHFEPNTAGGLPEAEEAAARMLYEGEVRYVDECVGRITRELGRLGLEEVTYICFTADHGEELWEHGEFGHGHTLYEELLHVPLIIAGRDVASRKIAQPVSAIDLMPTFAGLLGQTPPEDWHGMSLAGCLRDADADVSAKPCYAQATNAWCKPGPLRATVSGEHKLIAEVSGSPQALYDLKADPGELDDLTPRNPGLAESLGAGLATWGASFDSVFPAGEQLPGEVQERVEELKSVGYLP